MIWFPLLTSWYAVPGRLALPEMCRGPQQLIKFLESPVLPHYEYHFFREKRVPKTCRWILNNKNFLAWLNPSPQSGSKSRILWICGRPASGKSALASFIIRKLQKQELTPPIISSPDLPRRTKSSWVWCCCPWPTRWPTPQRHMQQGSKQWSVLRRADPHALWNLLFK